MTKFDMGAAWDDSIQLLKSHSALIGAIAGVFFFLPALAVAWFGPTPIEPPAGASVEQSMAALRETLRQMIPGQVIVGLSTIVGSAAILRLWLARTGISVGEALTFALMFFPTLLVVQILSGLAIGLGLILLIVPGLYMIGRLTLAAPSVADRSLYNPIQALKTSWELTRGNGWAIFFFLFLVTVVIFIAAMIVGLVVGLIAGADDGFGRMLGGVIEAGFGAIGSLVSVAISAAAYRQLAVRSASDVFQ